MRRLRDKLKLNNSGVGLVMVIVAIGMILILVTVLMSISLLNYQMKMTEKKSKENFYSAEQVLDEIHAGLEQVVSTAAKNAYTDALQSFSTVKESERVLSFRNTYLTNLRSQLRSEDSDLSYLIGAGDDYYNDETKLYDKAVGGRTGLCSYLDKTFAALLKGTDREHGTLKITYNGESTLQGTMDTTDEGLVLRDLCVEYTDEDGYYSKIQTDIVIQYPNISLTSGGTVSNFFDYAIVADTGIVFKSLNGTAQDTTVKASISAGENGISFENKNNTLSNCKVTFREGEQFPRIVSAGPIEIANSYGVDITASQVWATGITVTGGDTKGNGTIKNTWLNLNSNTYITDDLTIEGHNVSVTVKGRYYGYGSDSDSDGSAVILNCANSELDLSELEELLLEGNAYVNGSAVTGSYTSSDGTTTKNSDKSDVLLGTSLASKLDQVAFLVPAECLGTITDANGNVTSVVSENPMSQTEYYNWLNYETTNSLNDDERYQLLNISVTIDLLKKIDDNTLGSYGLSEASYKTIFRTKGSETLCYVYLDFSGNTADAALYYRAYMNAAQEKIERYLANYNNEVIYSNTVTDATSMGNLLTYTLSESTDSSTATAQMKIVYDSYSTLTNDESSNVRKEVEESVGQYKSMYDALKAKLTINDSLVVGDEANHSVYENEVITDNLSKVSATTSETYNDEITDATVIIANNGGGTALEVGSKSTNSTCALVIASGDVTVMGDFSGTILAGGTITIDTRYGGTISSDAETVTELLQLECDAHDATDITKMNTIAQQYLTDGDSYTFVVTADTNGEATVDLESIIKYINWKKE